MSAIHPEWILFGGIFIGFLVLLATMIGLGGWKKVAFVVISFASVVVLLGMTFFRLQSHKYDRSRQNACLNNLKLIQQAKQKWAREHPEINRELTENDLFPTNGYAICPGGGVYNMGRIGEKPKCSLDYKGHQLKD